MATDPVCKMEVNEAEAPGHVSYDDKEYYFCSKGCEQQFMHDPTQYIEKAA